MKFKFFKYIFFSIVVASVSSCGLVTNKYEKAALTEQQNNELYRGNETKDTSTIALIPWQDFFSDENLKSLIKEGLDKNYDLQNAILQISNTENILKKSKLAYLPSLNFSPTATFNKTSQNALNFPSNVNINLQTSTVSLGFSTNWELEVWGKLTSEKRSAQAAWMKSIASKNAVKTALVATIAETYYSLLALDKQLEITEETTRLREETVKTLKNLMEAGSVTGADVVQAEANLYDIQANVLNIKQAIRELENALCVLTVKPLQSIQRGNLTEQKHKIDLKTGIPSQLLSYRPDVLVAEYTFRQAFEMTNVAKASFYPSLKLSSGTGGISALTTRTLFDPTSIFVNLVGGLTQPIFQRGQLKTNHRNAKLTQQQAWNNFEKTLIVAGQEVTDALYSFQIAKEKQEVRTKQIEALEQSVDFRMELLKYSSNTTYTDVLLSEQNLIVAQLSGINDQLQEYKSLIALYRALGGGWK